MDIVYPDLPTAIYRDEVFEAVRILGFELKDVRSVKIDRAGVEIVVLPKLADGKRFVAGDEIASVTLRLPVSDRSIVKDEDAA